ncbi:hypothetical protein DMENIID0001_161690 [Sergentomyia squamirostris]
MWQKFIVVILCASATIGYRLQLPSIEVCPHALRVSMADSPGIQLFAFHGNINRAIGETEAGQMSKDVNNKIHGRWIFETDTETFKIGDTIHYWIYVQHRGLGYRSDVMRYTINVFSNRCEAYESDSSEEIDVHTDAYKFGRRRNKGENSSQFQHHYHHHHHHEEQANNRRTGHGTYGWNPPTGPPGFPAPLPFPTAPYPTGLYPGAPGTPCRCEQRVKEVVEKLGETRQQLENALNSTEKLSTDFQALSDVLGGILEKTNFGKKLLLTGVFGSNDNPYDFIRTILGDKLDLNDLKLKVLSATQTVHGAILFEMTTSADKLRILLRSKRLEKSKIRIIDYQDEDNELAATSLFTTQSTQSSSTSTTSSTTSPITDGPDPEIDVRFGDSEN